MKILRLHHILIFVLCAAMIVSGCLTGGTIDVAADSIYSYDDPHTASGYAYIPKNDMDDFLSSGKAFYPDEGTWNLEIYDHYTDLRIWFDNTFDIDVEYSTDDTDLIQLEDYRTDDGSRDGVKIRFSGKGAALIKIHVPKGQYYKEHTYYVNLIIKNLEEELDKYRKPKPQTGDDTGSNTGTTTGTTEPVVKSGQMIYGPDSARGVFGKPTALNLDAATDISYHSSNTAIATVNKSGIVSFKRPGTVIITAKAEEDDAFLSTVKHIKVTSKVKKPSLKCSARKKHANKLTWSKVPGASGYELYVRYPGSKKFIKAVTKKASVKSVVHKGITSGRKYKYKVRAFVTINGKKYYSPFSKVITVKVK